MNPTRLLALFLTAATLPAVAGTKWDNFLRQTQLDSGVIWDMPVDPKGTGPSPLLLEGSGALFQLWTLRKKDSKDFVLDQELVGAYLPKASVEITTGDPYTRAHRTRADQPFSVEFTVNGLLPPGPGIPFCSTMVVFEHHLATPEQLVGEITPSAFVAGSTPYENPTIRENNTYHLEFPVTNLTASDPSKASGQEHFVVNAINDRYVTLAQLASDYVQIWPVATGSIVGISAGDLVRFRSPTIELHLDDLYPSSTTYLQVYPGSPALGSVGKRIEGSTLVLQQDRPDDRVLRLPHWADVLTENGTYTLELITKTPFGTERLAWLSFELDRTIRVNAQVSTFEATRPTVITPTP